MNEPSMRSGKDNPFVTVDAYGVRGTLSRILIEQRKITGGGIVDVEGEDWIL